MSAKPATIEMIKTVAHALGFFLLIACVTVPQKGGRGLDVATFDSVQREMDATQVMVKIGSPQEIRTLPNRPNQDWWIYNKPDGTQQGSIFVDRVTKKVDSIMVMPAETDLEKNLDYLLKKKFSSLSFEKSPLQRCSRDYFPSEVFYIDTSAGVLITANRNTNEVESFSKVSPGQAKQFVDDVKNCRR